MVGSSGSPGGGGTLPSTPPVAAFSVSPEAPFPGTSGYFTDLSTNTPTSWSWKIDGVEFSIDQNPSYYFASPGTFEITLVATNYFGSNSTSQSIGVSS